MHIIITSLFVRVGGGGRKSKKKRYEKKIKWENSHQGRGRRREAWRGRDPETAGASGKRIARSHWLPQHCSNKDFNYSTIEKS